MDWGSLVERKIQDAMEAGEFDSLAGQGQKLHLDDEVMVDRSWWTAFKLLKNAGLAPEWIEIAKELRAEIQAARLLLDAAHRLDSSEGRGWHEALERFRAELGKINQGIDGLNLKVPSTGLQMMRLEMDREIEGCRRRTVQSRDGS